MSPSRSATAGRGGGGRAALTALIVVGVAVGMLLLVRSRPGVDAFDPRSSAANGTNASVLLLERFGATVTITARAPEPESDERVFVIVDRLNSDQRRDLLAFVDAGGVAVVADPASSLHGGQGIGSGAIEASGGSAASGGGVVDAADEANVPRGDCTIAALESLRGVFTPDGLLFPTGPDEGRCFTDRGHSFVIVRRHGEGIIVGFGDNRVVTNEFLRYADNAGLLTSLLAPADHARVRVMLGTAAKPAPEDIGTGDEKLLDLVRPGIWMALSQLALAFVVYCIARGVRPGRAVREPLPTPIAGNELVAATGNLMQRAHHHDRAGWLVRGEFYRQLCAHYRMPRDTSIDRLSEVVARRAGVDPNEVRAVLNSEVASADELARLVQHIDNIRVRTIAVATSGRTPERV